MDAKDSDRIIELTRQWQDIDRWQQSYELPEFARDHEAKAFRATQRADMGYPADEQRLLAEQHLNQAMHGRKVLDDRHAELHELANLHREHAPKLLKLVPIVDFSDAPPADLSPWLSAMRQIEAEFLSLLDEVIKSRDTVTTTADGPKDEFESEQYVTLDQMAALVNMSKRTLESRKSRKQNPLPFPDVDGGGGKADEWLYETIRPWLESEFGKKLPTRLAGNLRRDDRV